MSCDRLTRMYSTSFLRDECSETLVHTLEDTFYFSCGQHLFLLGPDLLPPSTEPTSIQRKSKIDYQEGHKFHGFPLKNVSKTYLSFVGSHIYCRL